MLREVVLHGELAKRFGKSFELDILTVREAVTALSSQLEGFKKYMLHAHIDGLKFAVFTDKIDETHNVIEDNLDNNTGAKVIHIVPTIAGAGGDNGVFQLIAGAVLIGVGVIAGMNPYLISMGASLALGGVTSMLMPTPDIGADDPDGNRPSNGFGGAVTTTAQGNPVPILYGERDVGGFIISGAIYTEDTA